MTNRAIAQIGIVFVLLFAVLIVRQLYVQVVAGPAIAGKPYNPRHALLDQHRGRILASDGTVLAQTIKNHRLYPFGSSLAQTVGYTSSRYGTYGIEDAYDLALTPPDTTGDLGAQVAQIVQAFSGATAQTAGADVVTTLNMRIQQTLQAQLVQYPRAAGIVLDPSSGAVLAIASVPSFDPNQTDALLPTLNHDAASPLLNRATSGLYPPGSTFKIFTAAAALDSGTVTMQSQFSDPGYLVIGNYTLHDDEGEVPQDSDLTGAFAHSSNVDFGQIALKLGPDKFYNYIDRFGIGGSLDFQLPAEHDRLPPKSQAYPGVLAQMGFGQASLLVTPMRMALVASTIANGGIEPRPYIVRQIRTGSSVSALPTGRLAEPISPDTAQNVKNMMAAVVKEGTGTVAALPGITVAGKTGTATNPAGRSHSWFVAFAPAEAPRVALAIVVENAGYGAAVAGPIAKAVLRTALSASSP